MDADGGDESPTCIHCGRAGDGGKSRWQLLQESRRPSRTFSEADAAQDTVMQLDAPNPFAHHDRGKEYAKKSQNEYDSLSAAALEARSEDEAMGAAFDEESFRFLSLDYASDVMRRFVWPTSLAEESEGDTAVRYEMDTSQSRVSQLSTPISELGESLGGYPALPTSNTAQDALFGVSIAYDAPSMERCLGYPAEAVHSSVQWWEERIHSDDRPRVILSLRRALESGTAKYWSESYRLRIYRGPPPTRPAMTARHRGTSSASVYTTSANFPSTQRPFARTISSHSASSNGSSSPSSHSARTGSGSNNTNSSTRRQYYHQSDSDDFLTVLDQLYITRDPNTSRPTSALGVIFAADQRIKLAEALNAPRSRLLRSIPKGGISFMGAETISTILQNTSSGLFMMDANGYPTYMNQAASDITGYSAIEEISNAPLHYAVHYKRPDGSDYPMEECPLDNANATLVRVQNQTEVFVKKDGTLFPVVWSCAPLERLGKTVGAVIEFRDVTEERKLEQERFKANLTAKHQEIKIKEAEAHRQRISQFVDYIAHELRNPLHGIAANIDFLRDSLESIQMAIDQRASDALSRRDTPPSLLQASKSESYTSQHRRSPSNGLATAPGSPGPSSLLPANASDSARLIGHRTSFNDLSKAAHNAQFNKDPQGHRPIRAESGGSNAKSPSLPPLISDFGQGNPFNHHQQHRQPRPMEALSPGSQTTSLPSAPNEDLRQALSTSRSFITSIQECVSHATHITNNVLDLSRLEAGKVELLDDLVYPAKVANLAIDMMAARAQEKDIELRLRLPGERTLVRGDGTRLAQVFLNLISNAIKFTPVGGRVDVVFDVTHEQERMLLQGSVTDSGVGMSPEEMGNLFQRFGQSSRNIQAEYGGTGLGLSICQEIVTLQGGKMHVDSTKGHGSTFSFTSYYGTVTDEEMERYLSQIRTSPEPSSSNIASPMDVQPSDISTAAIRNVLPQTIVNSAEQVAQMTPPDREEAAEEGQREPYTFKHVLVAEDNSINQNIMKNYLRKLGYNFTVVANGQEVLDVVEKAQDIPVDVILMDCEMPVMDGRKATQRVRELESFQTNLVTPLASPFDLNVTAYSVPTLAAGQSEMPSWQVSQRVAPDAAHTTRRTPIIGLSGNARKELIEEAYTAGMDDYVVKPFKLPDLQKVLKKWESAIDAQLQARAAGQAAKHIITGNFETDYDQGSVAS